MFAQLAADLLVILHLLFILFAVFGGWLAVKWRWVLFLHLPAAAWAALIEFQGWICPLTPLEQRFRQAAGRSSYQGGFVEHYVVPIIYPEGLTRDIQIVLGVLVIAANLAAYGFVLGRRKQGK
ncbi:MAG: DUF2784 domain-containing protein [Deltaproteobacteria bacterium]|nr:DUF2784 domain-containing protein [Deltaproteobacteria bacterium]